MARFLTLITILLFTIPLRSQNLLMFQKNRNKIAFYQSGDKISFRLKGDKARITQVIQTIEDSVLVFRFYRIAPEEISHLYVDNKTRIFFIFRYKYERLLLISGAGYMALDVINSGEADPDTLVMGSALIAGGLLARWLIPKALKIEGRKKLIIVNLKYR